MYHVARLRGGAAVRTAKHLRYHTTTKSRQNPVSPHVGFYSTFTRPIAKVLLMAAFTYQFAYWGWVYLEKGEIKKQKSAEVEVLEKLLAELTRGKEKKP